MGLGEVGGTTIQKVNYDSIKSRVRPGQLLKNMWKRKYATGGTGHREEQQRYLGQWSLMLCWTGRIIPGINFFPFLCESVPGKKKMFARVTGRFGQTLKNKWKGETKGKDFNSSHNNNWDLFWFVDLVFSWEADLRKMRTGAAGICAWSVASSCLRN